MGTKFKPLDDESEHRDTVLSFSSLIPSSMFKVNDLMTAVKQSLQGQGLKQLRSTLSPRGGIPGNDNEWYNQGVDCEFLKPGSNGWKKGKVRITVTLEFCPDEPEVKETPESNKLETSHSESPLDDIRRVMFENNQ